MSFTRNLTFRSHDLGADATLMFVFKAPSSEASPVVWKVARFAAQGPYMLNVTFSSQLAWLKPAIAMGSIVNASAYTAINSNQVTTLQQDGSGVYLFTAPEEGTPGYVSAVNGTTNRQDFALGFLPPGNPSPVPTLYWSDIPASGTINTNFPPVLQAYIINQYREGEIVRGEISSPVIFEQNLAALGETTVWQLRYDFATGAFSITQM